jgi:hypothetical protein
VRYNAPMIAPTDLLPGLSLVLLLAACPADKGNTTGESTADTTGTTVANTGTVGGDTTVTEASATQDPGCAPIACDECLPGCTAKMVCIGSQASCECTCEENTGGGSVAESTSAQESSGTTGTTGSGTTGEPAIACGGDMPFFPEFDRSCAAPADCALGFHQLDCCGSLAALGINADAAKLFAEAEAECMMQYPQCDCATKPTVADDGNSSPDNNVIAVDCVAGQCRSFVP